MTEGRERLYLDDLAVGQRFASGPHALDAGQIKAFAAAFDPQPFHLDEAAAASSLFGGPGGERLAHGGDHHAPAGRQRAARGRRDRGRRRDRLAPADPARATC